MIVEIDKNGFILDKNEELFLKVKKLEQVADTTLKNYKSLFARIENRIQEKLDYANEDNLSSQILNFFTEINFYKPSAYNGMVKQCNCYFNYLIKIKKIKNNPLKILGIKERKVEFNPRPCDTEDLIKLLKVIDVHDYVGLRDYTSIMLIVDTGIRPSEAFRLEKTDINFETNIIKVRKEISKTKTGRILPVSTKVMIYLKALLKYKFDTPYVFNTEEGQNMTTDRFGRRLGKYSWYADVKITPYQLRHYFGTEYAKNKFCNILYLQKIMGHSKLEMTRRYVKIDEEDLARNHKLASPIDKLD